MDPTVFGDPYRPPCGGWPSKSKVGVVVHYRSGDKCDYWKNTTLVAEGALGTGTQKPYARADTGVNNPGCNGESEGCNCPGVPDPLPTNPALPAAPIYGPWDPAEFPICPSGTGLKTYDLNCYAKQGTTKLDYGVWRKLGFKNAQAIRYWHGMSPLLSHDPAGRYNRRPVSFANATASGDNGWINYTGETSVCDQRIEDEQTTPSRTKYLNLSVTAEIAFTDSATPANNYDESVTLTSSVNANSGVTKVSIPTNTDHDALAWVHIYRPSDGLNLYETTAVVFQAGWDADHETTITETSADGITWEWTEQGWYWDTPGSEYVLKTKYHQTLNVETGEYHSQQYGWNAAGTTWFAQVATDIAVSNTGFSFVQVQTTHGNTYDWVSTRTVTGLLTVENTAASIWSDMKDLLALWPLDDDKLYPWRMDEYVTAAPLVGRNEVQQAVSPEGGLGQPSGWLDPHDPDNPSALFDDVCSGTITGAPISYYVAGEALAGGYGPHFDHQHKTWDGCYDGDENPVPYIHKYGARSGSQPGHGTDLPSSGDPTDDCQPPGATRWLENWPWPGRLPPGAWVMAAAPHRTWSGGWDGQFITSRVPGLFMAQKWAEIKIPRRSHNFFRPCGADRYELDTARVYCVASAGGSPLVVVLKASTSLTVGTPMIYTDGAGKGAVYTVASGSGTTWTMSAKVADVPDSDARPVGTLAKLRWYTTAWPVCGRIAIGAATDNEDGTVDLVLTTPADGLQTGDHVDFSGAGWTGPGSNIAVTVSDSTHVTIPGYLSADYVSVGYMASHGAPNFKWNDANAKGEYLLIRWLENQRDYQERDRAIAQWAAYSACHWGSAPGAALRVNQATHGMPRAVYEFHVDQECLSFSECCPMVMCISPNDESWDNGTTHWPDDAAIAANIGDDRYGFMYQAVIQQDLPDPLWQEPAAPCTPDGDVGCGWAEDLHGLCVVDVCDPELGGTRYFARRPVEEAHQGSATIGADTSPALPTGCYLGYLLLAALDTTSSVNGNVLPPPVTGTDAAGALRLEGYWYDSSGSAGLLIPNTPITPWLTYQHQIDCVCNATRPEFAVDYMRDSVPNCW